MIRVGTVVRRSIVVRHSLPFGVIGGDRVASSGNFGKRSFWSRGTKTPKEESASIPPVESNIDVSIPKDESSSVPTVENSIDKLFQEQEATNIAADAVAATQWDPTWYNVADLAVEGIGMMREATGMGYGASIVASTVAIRIFMFPLFVKLQKNSARMAHMQPEMQALKSKIDSLGTNVSQETQMKYGLQMRALFKKYDCNPLSSFIPPLIQIPVFMGMFFGLRKMPDYFANDLSTEGLFWFQDLTRYDPYYMLPVASAATMLASVELNKESMMASNPKQGEIMINVFRAMSLIMVPAVSKFSAALNLYWFCNNTITAAQAALFRNKAARKSLGIWEMPKAVPGMPQPKSVVETIKDAVEQKPSEEQLMKDHNEAIDQKKRQAAAKTPQSNRRGRKKFRPRSK